MQNFGQAPEQVGPVGGGNAGWLNLKEGTYRVRLVSGYAYIGYHFNNATKKSTVCPNRAKGDDLCEQCRFLKDGAGKLYSQAEANAIRDNEKKKAQEENRKPKDLKFYYNRPSQKYVVNILDLNDVDDNNVPKIKHCEFPFKLIEIMNAYAMNPDYQFDTLPGWDMSIVRKNGNTQTEVTWSVQPARQNRELSPAEMELVDNAQTPDDVVNKKHNYAARDEEENDPNNYASQDAQADQAITREPITDQDIKDAGFEIENEDQTKGQDGPGEQPRKDIDPELGF